MKKRRSSAKQGTLTGSYGRKQVRVKGYSVKGHTRRMPKR